MPDGLTLAGTVSDLKVSTRATMVTTPRLIKDKKCQWGLNRLLEAQSAAASDGLGKHSLNLVKTLRSQVPRVSNLSS